MSVENPCYIPYKKYGNRVSEQLALFLLFSIPLLLYYGLVYSALLLLKTKLVLCYMCCQLITLASIHSISRLFKVDLAELYFNRDYKVFGKNTIIFIALILLIFTIKHYFIVGTSIFAVGVVLAPILEEMLFRGFLYDFLKSIVKPLPLIFIANSLMFTVVHLDYIGDTQTLFRIFLIGMFSCYLKHRYNSLIPCTYLHFLNNLSIFLG